MWHKIQTDDKLKRWETRTPLLVDYFFCLLVSILLFSSSPFVPRTFHGEACTVLLCSYTMWPTSLVVDA